MKNKDFTNGLKDGIPIALGYFSVSMAFGLTAAMLGFPVWSAVLVSLTNVTSAGQAAAIQIMAHSGKILEIVITTLIINMRYFLMSLSVSQKADSSMSVLKRMAVSFGITDEVFAVSMRRQKPLTATYMAGLILLPVIGWTSGTFAGSIATNILPPELSAAMGIALYGMFVAIIIPPARENRNVLFTVIMAVAAGFIFHYAPVLKNISSGWTTIIITVIVSSIAATFMPLSEKGDNDGQ